MRLRDLVMIMVSLAAMGTGIMLPSLAEPLRFLPRICLMILLFLGFLSVGTEALFARSRCMPGTVCALTLARLLGLPLVAFAVFEAVMPSFALGALLVASASIGVVAPVFSLMVKADTALVLVGNLLTSLLLPLTLPLLLSLTATLVGLLGLTALVFPAELSLIGMTFSLAVTILVPFVCAFLIRKNARATEAILKRQFPLAILTCGLSTLAIFSHYAETLHQSPILVVQAIGAACLLGGIMMLCGLALPRNMEPQRKLAFLISYGTMNNVLMLIVSTEFFGVNESLIAAMYLIPLNGLLLLYRHCSRLWAMDAA